MGKWDEALAECHEALRIDPSYAHAHSNLGVVLLSLGRRDEAVAEFREALRLSPNDESVKTNLRQLEAQK